MPAGSQFGCCSLISHLGFRTGAKQAIFIVAAPLLLLLTGLFAASQRSHEVVWGTAAIGAFFQELLLAGEQLETLRRTVNTLLPLGLAIGAYYPFKNDFAAVILNASVWSYLLGYG